jgi:polygalacturonase
VERRKFLGRIPLVVGGALAAGVGEAVAQSQPTTTYVNVKQYGATGNGVTDDTAALQLAFTSCAGRVLYVPTGTYLVSDLCMCPPTRIYLVTA